MKNNHYAAETGETKLWTGMKLADDLGIAELLEGDLAGSSHSRVGLGNSARRALADAVNERMAEYGLTNRKLATIAELDVALISRIRNGHENPKLETIVKVAHALDFTLEQIFSRINKPAEPPASE